MKKEIPAAVKENYKRIIRKISRMQNGDVAKILHKLGLAYRLNYGVSIPQLRQLISEFEPNNQLAFLLWEKDIRETKILASHLFDVSELSHEMALMIATKINNQELIEQYSRNLFCRTPYLLELVKKWMQGNQNEKILALYSAGWHIRQGGANTAHLKGICFSNIETLTSDNQALVYQSLGFVMHSISVCSDHDFEEMKKLAEKLMLSDKPGIQRMGEEFLWLNTK